MAESAEAPLPPSSPRSFRVQPDAKGISSGRTEMRRCLGTAMRPPHAPGWHASPFPHTLLSPGENQPVTTFVL